MWIPEVDMMRGINTRPLGLALPASAIVALIAGLALLAPAAQALSPGYGWRAVVYVDYGVQPADVWPRLVVDDNGVATVAYQQLANCLLCVRHYVQGQGWTSVAALAGGGNPTIAADRGGNVTAVFQNNGQGMQAQRYTPLGGWGAVTTVNTEAAGGGHSYTIAASEGGAVVVWLLNGAFGDGVWASNFTAASGWSSPAQLSNVRSFAPNAAMDESGNALAVWSEGAVGQPLAIRSAVLLGGQGWQSAVTLHSDGGSDQRNGVAMTADGNFAVAYAVPGVTVRRYAVGSGWSAEETVTASGSNASTRPLRMESDGNRTIFVVYGGQGIPFWRTYAVRYTSALGWGSPVDLRPSSDSTAYMYDLSVSARGDAMALWVDFNSTSEYLYAARFSASVSSWNVTLVRNLTGMESSWPKGAVDPNGNATVVWGEYNASAGSYHDLLSRRFLRDTVIPPITIASPTGNLTNQTAFNVTGITEPGARLFVFGNAALVAPNGSFVGNFSGPDGNYTILVNATDEEGNQNSKLLNITIDTAPPALLILSPVNGSLVNRTAVNITGSTEPGANVTMNNMSLVVLPTGAFAARGTLSEGWNYLRFEAVDRAGNRARGTLSLLVDTLAPALRVDTPDNSTTNRSLVAVTGTTDPGATVTVNGSSVAVAPNGSFAASVPLGEGPNLIVIRARDAALNLNETSITMFLDTLEPFLMVDPPADALVNDPNVEVTGWTDRGAAVEVDGHAAFVDQSGRFYASLVLSDGVHALAVTATDSAGNLIAAWYNITVDTVPPSVTVLAPANAGPTKESVLVVFGLTDPDASAMVAGGSVQVAANGSFTATIVLHEGNNTFSVEATDLAGNVVSRVVVVRLDTLLDLVLTEKPPALTNLSVISIKGTTEPGATVSAGGVTLPVDGDGAFAGTLALADGRHNITVTATDLAGNQNSTAFFLEVDTTAPEIAIAGAVDGSTVNVSSVTITVRVEPGASLRVDGRATVVPSNGSVVVPLTLAEGRNTVVLEARDQAGNARTRSLNLTFTLPAVLPGENPPPTTKPNTNATAPTGSWPIWVAAAAGLALAAVVLVLARRRRAIGQGVPGAPAPAPSAAPAVPAVDETPSAEQRRAEYARLYGTAPPGDLEPGPPLP